MAVKKEPQKIQFVTSKEGPRLNYCTPLISPKDSTNLEKSDAQKLMHVTFCLSSRALKRTRWCHFYYHRFGKYGSHIFHDKRHHFCKNNNNNNKTPSVMVWGCASTHGIDNLHIWEGTINARRHRHICSHPDDVFFSKTMHSHITCRSRLAM